jgi:hypothetical protein
VETQEVAEGEDKHPKGHSECVQEPQTIVLMLLRPKSINSTSHAAHYHQNVKKLKNQNVKGSFEEVANFSKGI